MTIIATKRVYEAAEPEDGLRVLVDRLWPRGFTKEEAAIALWLKESAPSTNLRKWFNHEPARWDEFRARYREELEHSRVAEEFRQLSGKHSKISLIYAAKDPEHNHAVVLLDFLKNELSKKG